MAGPITLPSPDDRSYEVDFFNAYSTISCTVDNLLHASKYRQPLPYGDQDSVHNGLPPIPLAMVTLGLGFPMERQS